MHGRTVNNYACLIVIIIKKVKDSAPEVPNLQLTLIRLVHFDHPPIVTVVLIQVILQRQFHILFSIVAQWALGKVGNRLIVKVPH